MVDSAVNLTIGTELDLSGLERDLAALKKQTAEIQLSINADKFFSDLDKIRDSIDCIGVALCIDDSKLVEILEKKYKVNVAIETSGLDLKEGKISVSAETLGVDIDGLEKSVNRNFSELLDFLKDSESALRAQTNFERNTKPIFDLATGFFESIGRDAKKGLEKSLKEQTGFDLKDFLSESTGGTKVAGGDSTVETANNTQQILKETVEIAGSAKAILSAVKAMQSPEAIPESVGTILSEVENLSSKFKGESSALAKEEKSGGLSRIGSDIQSTLAQKTEAFLVDAINNALAITPGQKGVIDVSKRIESLQDVDPKLLTSLAQKGLLQTVIGTTQAARGTYGALKGAENAVLSFDPTGIAKVVKSVVTPLALTAAATQVPGVGMAVGGAVELTEAALAPLANALGGEAIGMLSGAIADVVGGLPIIGAQLEAGLVSTLTTVITETVMAATGIAATGVVGKALESGTGAIAGAIAPDSKAASEKARMLAERATNSLLSNIEDIVDRVSELKLPATTRIIPSALPSYSPKQLKGTLESDLNVKGLQDVFKQIRGESGVGQTRKQLVSAILDDFKEDAKAVKEALAKVSKEGIKAGSSMGTFGKPQLQGKELESFIAEVKKVRSASAEFSQRFDSVSDDVKKQTVQGLEQLIRVVNYQIKTIETVKKEFAVSGKVAQSLGGYESQLKQQLSGLQSRQSKLEDMGATKAGQNWKNTAMVVKGAISSMVDAADANSYDLQRKISEGSPGPTFFIREAWSKTANFVSNKIQEMVGASANASQKLENNIKPPSKMNKVAEDVANGFRNAFGVIDDLAGGKDIEEKLKQRIDRIVNSARITDDQKEILISRATDLAAKRKSERGELTSNVSTLVGSTAFSFAPQQTLEALTIPFSVAFMPLIAAFQSARQTITDFVVKVADVLRQIEPIQIRFNTVSSEQNRYLEQEIEKRKASIAELETTGQDGAKLIRERKTLASLQQQGMSTPESLMAVPEQLARDYSIPLTETLDAYSKFVSASTGTALAGKGVENLFVGVSQAIEALGLNAQESELVFLAFQQMMSKGKISAEELRQQLAERMPGAFQLFAEALGVSQVELNKLLETGSLQSDVTLLKVAELLPKRYGEAAKEAGDSFIGSLTKIDNAVKRSQMAIVEVMSPAFKAVADGLVNVLNVFSDNAVKIFGFVSNLFADVVLTMAVSWSAVWSQMGKSVMTMVTPLMSTIYKYLAPFGINIGVDFIDNFYNAITGQDAMSPLETIFKGIENVVWASFTAIKEFGDGVTSIFQNIAATLQSSFGSAIELFSKLTNAITAMGVPLIEMATTFVFVNQTMAFFGVNSAFIKSAMDNLAMFFTEVTTGAGRMNVLQNAIKGVTLGLNDFQLQAAAATSLLLVFFAKSDFADPLKVELDKTLQSLEAIKQQALETDKATSTIGESMKSSSKGFNVTFGISEALGGQKIMTDDVIRALRGDLGDAANKAAYGFLAVISGGIGVAMLPMKEIGVMLTPVFDSLRASLYVGAAQLQYAGQNLVAAFNPLLNNIRATFYTVIASSQYFAKNIIAGFAKTGAIASQIGAGIISSVTAAMPTIAAGFKAVFMGLTPIFTRIAQVMGAVFSGAMKALSAVFASLGKVAGMAAGVALPKGLLGGVVVIGATIAAVITDVFTGGAVRAALTDLAKKFGLVAIDEMQAEQRRKKRAEAVTGVLDATKGQFFVELNPGGLEKEMAALQEKLNSGVLEGDEKGIAKNRIKELKTQIEGQKLFGKTFTSELTEETKSALAEIESVDKSIISIQQRMNEVGKLSVSAEMAGDDSSLTRYNTEYEKLNQQLQQELATRSALAKPYEEFLTLLENSKTALTDELKALQDSGQYDPESVADINAQISRVDATIAALKQNGVTNLTLLQNEFNNTAASIDKNNERLGILLQEINRVKAIEMTNIAEAFAAGDISDSERAIKESRSNLKALQKELDVTSATYEANSKALEGLMLRPSSALSDEEKTRRDELIKSVQDQEMQVYDLRTNIANATVESRQATEEAMADFVAKSAERITSAVESEGDALTKLRSELQKTVGFAKTLSEESGEPLTFDLGKLQTYQQYLESVAGTAARLNIDLGGYVQEFGQFAQEQAEINKLMASGKPEDAIAAQARQKSLGGRQQLAMKDISAEIQTARLDRDLSSQIASIQSAAPDPFEGDVLVQQSYLTRSEKFIDIRKQQLSELAALESSGLITKAQRLQQEKKLNDEIESAQSSILERNEKLLMAEMESLDNQKKLALESTDIKAREARLTGDFSIAEEGKLQSERISIIADFEAKRQQLLQSESEKNKQYLLDNLISYEEFIEREKALLTQREDANTEIFDALSQTRSEGLAAISAEQDKEIALLTQQIEGNKKLGIDRITSEQELQKKLDQAITDGSAEKLKYIEQEKAFNLELLNSKKITYGQFLELEQSLADESYSIQKEATDRETALTNQKIDLLWKLEDLRAKITEAQLKGQEALSRSSSVYSDALSKQGEIVRARADLEKKRTEDAIATSEKALQGLEGMKSVVSSLQSSLGIEDKKAAESTKKEIQSMLSSFGISSMVDPEKLAGMDAGQLSEIKKALTEAKKLGITTADLQGGGIQALDEKIMAKSLEIEQQKAELLEKEQETQRKLLALEIERNKVAAQTAIREAEIEALRAKAAVASAQVGVQRATTPEELIQSQIDLQLAKDELQFALAGVDVSRQNAVIGDRLSSLQAEGLGGALPGIELDPTVRGLVNISESMKGITDFGAYDELLAQLDRAAAPLETELAAQDRMIESTNKLTSGIDLLNQKIERLVTTLGRPNVNVSGGSSIADALEVMRKF